MDGRFRPDKLREHVIDEGAASNRRDHRHVAAISAMLIIPTDRGHGKWLRTPVARHGPEVRSWRTSSNEGTPVEVNSAERSNNKPLHQIGVKAPGGIIQIRPGF
jgi:hypothetical protein